ncbi:hypothetical protein [Clostridiisalibacter paucivorans]|uniref:hypothetical protein n=1 Tax=Clostridiisalibacter paucivorans TaxID=408753 RepID=UPI00047D1879|nr:hypothetical protein [Clostridiisalibacter paucivorans]
MNMNERDSVKKKILDSQEMVRDYEMLAKQTTDTELAETFKIFAEESGMQARRLQAIMDKMEGKSKKFKRK